MIHAYLGIHTFFYLCTSFLSPQVDPTCYMDSSHHLPSLVADAYASSSSDEGSDTDEHGDAKKPEVRATDSKEIVKKPAAASLDASMKTQGVEPAPTRAAKRNAGVLRHGDNRNSTQLNPSASSLPPELVRELKRARKKGGGKSLGVIPDFIEIDASLPSSQTAQSAHASEGERHRTRHLAAQSLRKAGVSKAARRNHHITELMAAARADKIVQEAKSRRE